jgi:hypothetical protein
MKKYESVTINISLVNEKDEEDCIYQQAFVLDNLNDVNPLWLPKVISVLNNLELKNV